jgi:hypothetical protein
MTKILLIGMALLSISWIYYERINIGRAKDQMKWYEGIMVDLKRNSDRMIKDIDTRIVEIKSKHDLLEASAEIVNLEKSKVEIKAAFNGEIMGLRGSAKRAA